MKTKIIKHTTGVFTISLDFELIWGVFDKVNITDKSRCFQNTMDVIPEILALFTKYEIEATWATVGMLFNENSEQFKNNLPNKLPHYTDNKISAYHYFKKIYNEKYKKYHFATKLIKKIHNTKGQEIGTHTYSHYYCLENGQKIDDFNADLFMCNELATKYNIHLKSIVLPRNQYNKTYNEICFKNGIKILRTNPKIWFWNTFTKETLLKKIFRTGDCYFPLFKSYYNFNNIERIDKQLILLPASRFFRPLSKYKLLNEIRLNRIKNEMTNAAKKNMFYHLWWHPHNFGNFPNESLIELEELLIHYIALKKKYHFKSLNMKSVYETFF